MQLVALDWWIVIGYLLVALSIGLFAARRSGKSSTDYFLSGRSMPWWVLGVSMVATTFSTDTPNLVANIVRENGVSGNWVWWAFLLTGMLTVFVYAKLWRKAGVLTDLEFYEIRYSGESAAFLRGFRAIYLGVLANTLIMATVTLAAIKIAGVLLGLSPIQTVLIAGGVTVLLAAAGGLRSVLVTDVLLFVTAMVGAVAAAVYALDAPGVGGLNGLLNHESVVPLLPLFPDVSDRSAFISLLIIPIAVQWWSVWYPGAEPGGGGYIAQRMLSARNERGATSATLLFNVAHYVLRPWPWIIVGLASVIVFPGVEDIAAAFPSVQRSVVGNDMAYPAMLTFLPAGLLGLVVASLAAAYVSTMSTHLNWGASYLVNDFWVRFVDRDCTEASQITVGRVSTLFLMVLAGALALVLEDALSSFEILLKIGAGTGLLFILRWFWWRINAFSEIAAMVSSFGLALYFELLHHRLFPDSQLDGSVQLVLIVVLATVAWVSVTYLTRPTERATLKQFCELVNPGGPGWKEIGPVEGSGEAWFLPRGIIAMVVGSIAIYSALFAVGYLLYGMVVPAVLAGAVAMAGALYIARIWSMVSGES